jgi:hypothetical protein
MVYWKSRRWMAAGCFEAIIRDLRAILRFVIGTDTELTAANCDGPTIGSTEEGGGWAG